MRIENDVQGIEKERFEDLMKKEEEIKQEELSISSQMLKDYSNDADENELGYITRLNAFAYEKAQAEKIRLKLIDKQQGQVEKPREIQEPDSPEPVFKPYGNMWLLKRKKLDSRRSNNLANARKMGIPQASAETLPLMQEIKEYNKAKEKVRLTSYTDWGERSRERQDINLFSPVPYQSGRDTTIDVRKVMGQIDVIQATINGSGYDDDEQTDVEAAARITALKAMQQQMKTTISAILAVEGVNFDGTHITAKNDVNVLLKNKDEAIKKYKDMVKNKDNLIFEEYQKHMQEPLQKLIQENEETFKPENLSEKIKNAFDSNPEKYNNNKAVLDAVFKQYFDLLSMSNKLNLKVHAFNLRTAPSSYMNEDDDLWDRYEKSLFPEKLKDSIGNTMSSLESIMLYLLEGKEMSRDDHVVLEHGYGYTSKERIEQVNELFESDSQEIEAIKEPIKKEMALTLLERKQLLAPTLRYVDKAALKWKKKHGVKDDKTVNYGFDFRQLFNMTTGYKTNENGEPTDDTEAEKMLKDMELIDDFFSDNPVDRVKHLEKAADDVFSLKITEEMTNPEYIQKNFKELRTLAKRFHVFTDVDYLNLLKEHSPERYERMQKESDLRMNFMVAMTVYIQAYGLDDNVQENANIVKNFIPNNAASLSEKQIEKGTKENEEDAKRNNLMQFGMHADMIKMALKEIKEEELKKKEEKEKKEIENALEKRWGILFTDLLDVYPQMVATEKAMFEQMFVVKKASKWQADILEEIHTKTFERLAEEPNRKLELEKLSKTGEELLKQDALKQPKEVKKEVPKKEVKKEVPKKEVPKKEVKKEIKKEVKLTTEEEKTKIYEYIMINTEQMSKLNKQDSEWALNVVFDNQILSEKDYEDLKKIHQNAIDGNTKAAVRNAVHLTEEQRTTMSGFVKHFSGGANIAEDITNADLKTLYLQAVKTRLQQIKVLKKEFDTIANEYMYYPEEVDLTVLWNMDKTEVAKVYKKIEVNKEIRQKQRDEENRIKDLELVKGEYHSKLIDSKTGFVSRERKRFLDITTKSKENYGFKPQLSKYIGEKRQYKLCTKKDSVSYAFTGNNEKLYADYYEAGGDGNCLFNAICAKLDDLKLPNPGPVALRQMCAAISEKATIRPYEWAEDIDIALLANIFGVNIEAYHYSEEQDSNKMMTCTTYGRSSEPLNGSIKLLNLSRTHYTPLHDENTLKEKQKNITAPVLQGKNDIFSDSFLSSASSLMRQNSNAAPVEKFEDLKELANNFVTQLLNVDKPSLKQQIELEFYLAVLQRQEAFKTYKEILNLYGEIALAMTMKDVYRVKEFKTGIDVDTVYRPKTEKWWAGLSKEQREAAYTYTQDSRPVNMYLRGYDYEKNQKGEDAWVKSEKSVITAKSKEDIKIAKLLEEAINKSSLEENTILYRGSFKEAFEAFLGINETELRDLSVESIEKLSKKHSGRMVKDPGFCSTSATDGAFADDFKVKYIIEAQKGSKAIYCEPFSAFGAGEKHYSGKNAKTDIWDGKYTEKNKNKETVVSNEVEILLQKGTVFHVNEIKYEKDKICVYLKTVPTGQV
ncbi:MAG: hypothetical protein FWD34_06020 [Oscillospiraceae bacterium]|nr:hypothetical protein [Oscillospiraceae bacterium]